MPSARRGKLWLVMPALLTAGLSVITPAHATTRTATVTTAYVANEVRDTVTPINAATDTAGRPIPILGDPYALTATPDGRTVYVASIDNRPAPPQEYVTPIDTATGRPGTPIPGATAPMAMSPDGKTLYAAGGGGLAAISTAANTITARIPLNGSVFAIAISPDGRRAYVAGKPPGSQQGSVTGINLVTDRVVRAICVGSAAALAVTPDSSTVYAAGGGILPISAATMTAGTPIYPAGAGFPALQLSPDGKTLWALAYNGFLDRINVATGKPLPAIRIRGELETLTVTPKTVFVGQRAGWGRLVPVSAVTGIRGPDIPGARFITATALSPDGKTLWALGLSSGTAVPVSVATGKPGRPVPVGDDPADIVVVTHRT
jgi:DNA-binding beta-propeller fold protein YncE